MVGRKAPTSIHVQSVCAKAPPGCGDAMNEHRDRQPGVAVAVAGATLELEHVAGAGETLQA